MNYTKTNLENLNLRRSLAFRFITHLALFFAVALGAIPFASAQMSDEPTTVELDQFRSDLARVTEELNINVAALKRSPALQNSIAQVKADMPEMTSEMRTKAQKQLQKMSYEELALVYKAFRTHFPKWREAPGVIASLTSKLNSSKNVGGAQKTGIDTAPNAITPDNCQDAFNAAPSWTDWGAVQGGAVGAQAAYEVIPPPLNIAAMAIWTPLAVGVTVAETLNNMFDRCSGDQTAAELQASIDSIQNSQTEVISTVNASTSTIVNNDNTNKDTILNSVTSNATTINNAITNAKTDIVNNDNANKTAIISNATTNTATLTTAITAAQTNINNTIGANTLVVTNAVTSAQNTIVANDNANKTAIINNANANTTTLNTMITNAKNDILANANANATALSDLLLRSQIEADLATESNGVKVAWYMTPTTNGGHLDLVQQIVTQTLANITASGGSIGNAQLFLNRANADKAAGNFKSAYDNYRKAYKAAAN